MKIKVVSVKIFLGTILALFSSTSFALFETGDEKINQFFKKHKEDELLKDVFENVYVPPYEDDSIYKEGVRLCRNEVFSDSYKVGAAKLIAREDYLGYAANVNAFLTSFISNSGGIDQLFNVVEYDVVMLNTYRNSRSSRKAANIVHERNSESPQIKKVMKWLKDLDSKDNPEELKSFMICLRLEIFNTVLKNSDGLFKEDLSTVRFQIHNQESGRTKTLLAP